ncbi:MAG: hypothetical protein JXB17_03185 [Bacteroidales bacterium]|nr:hypothetical protein [Bacteroidales bacterium]
MKTKVFKMRKAAKIAVMIIVITIVGLSSIAQDSYIKGIENNQLESIYVDLYALIDLLESKEVTMKVQAELITIEYAEGETELNIEPWMTERFSGSELSWEVLETEEELVIEDWMVEKNEIVEADEPELELESWMTNPWLN